MLVFLFLYLLMFLSLHLHHFPSLSFTISSGLPIFIGSSTTVSHSTSLFQVSLFLFCHLSRFISLVEHLTSRSSLHDHPLPFAWWPSTLSLLVHLRISIVLSSYASTVLLVSCCALSSVFRLSTRHTTTRYYTNTNQTSVHAYVQKPQTK